jgi:hypothetical protein
VGGVLEDQAELAQGNRCTWLVPCGLAARATLGVVWQALVPCDLVMNDLSQVPFIDRLTTCSADVEMLDFHHLSAAIRRPNHALVGMEATVLAELVGRGRWCVSSQR